MRIERLVVVLAAAVALAGSLARPADAAVIIDVTEIGGDVVAVFSGSLDTTGLVFANNVQTPAGVNPGFGFIGVGAAARTFFDGINGPSSFGPGGFLEADSAFGDYFAIATNGTRLGFNLGYVSGSDLSGSATWNTSSFTSLGMTPGTYVWTLPSQDTVTLNIGIEPIPEPASLAIFGLGAAGLALLRRRNCPSVVNV